MVLKFEEINKDSDAFYRSPSWHCPLSVPHSPCPSWVAGPTKTPIYVLCLFRLSHCHLSGISHLDYCSRLLTHFLVFGPSSYKHELSEEWIWIFLPHCLTQQWLLNFLVWQSSPFKVTSHPFPSSPSPPQVNLISRGSLVHLLAFAPAAPFSWASISFSLPLRKTLSHPLRVSVLKPLQGSRVPACHAVPLDFCYLLASGQILGVQNYLLNVTIWRQIRVSIVFYPNVGKWAKKTTIQCALCSFCFWNACAHIHVHGEYSL